MKGLARIIALFLLPLVMVAHGVEAQAGDTLKFTRKVRSKLERVYFPSGGDWSWYRGLRPMAGEGCDGNAHTTCFEDPDRGPCEPNQACINPHPLHGLLMTMEKGVRRHPDAGWVVGYLTYTLVKLKQDSAALAVAKSCRATGWWCSLLEGYVRDAMGRPRLAEPLYRAALRAGPDTIRCMLTNASLALDESLRIKLMRMPCSALVTLSETVWWLADPLYSVPGNERWVAQVSRSIDARIFYVHGMWEDTPYGPIPSWWEDFILTARIPRGLPDSWQRMGYAYSRAHHGIAFTYGTSRARARYHFVPDFLGNDLTHPVWHLDGSLDEEGYTPPGEVFYQIPAQIARFRRGHSMVVAVAGDLAGTPLSDAPGATAHLVLTDAPKSFPLSLSSPVRDGRAVFLAWTSPRSYVTSYEVLTDSVYGRHRVVVHPLLPRGPGVSDLLLYSPVGPELPDSLRMAAGMMLGDTILTQDDELGVYWETYGAPKGTPVNVELQVQRREGALGRIKDILPGVGGNGSGRPGWTETSPGPVFRRAVDVDLENLAPGNYTLMLKTSWPGQQALESRRAFVVTQGEGGGS